MSAALVAGIFLGVLPRVAELSEVAATIGAMTWLELSTLGAVALWNLASYWVVLMAVLPGLSFGRAAAVNLVGGAVSNTIPGGGAVAVGATYAMLSSWGFPPPAIALSVLVSGIWNTFVKLGIPVIALALLVVQHRASTSLVVGAALGLAKLVGAVVLYALVLGSPRLAERVGTWLGRLASWLRGFVRRPTVHAWGVATVRFRSQTIHLLRGRWPVITAASLLSHLALTSCSAHPAPRRRVGGGRELGLTGALVLAGGERAQVVAAVLVYRMLTYLPTTRSEPPSTCGGSAGARGQRTGPWWAPSRPWWAPSRPWLSPP